MNNGFALSALILALPLCGAPPEQPPFPGEDLVGVQGRASVPGAGLAGAVGSSTLGLGAGIQAELHFAPYRFDRDQCRFAARLELGADSWRKLGGSSGRSATAYHAGAEGLYFLRDDGREFLNGPYLLAGAEGIAWSVGAAASDTGAAERTLRLGFTGGLGWRLDRHLDMELKVLGSEVDPALKVGAAMVCVNYWF